MALDLPGDWNLVDIRWPIPGNSFEWGPNNLEPAAAKKRIVIHGTASEAPNEDGFTMGGYHTNHNGWPGIGVNFVVTQDSYPGRGYDGGSTPAGSQVQYVGDGLTIRAGAYGMNEGSLHIEICGLFTPGHNPPSENQLRNTRHLIDKLLEKNNIFPSLNFYSQVVYHNQIAVPGYGTACPGWQHPQFGEWFGYLQGGAEPSWWKQTPPPVVVPPPPPIVVPEYEATYKIQVEKKPILRDGASAVNVLTGAKVADIPKGQIVDIAGYFDSQGQKYARTVYSATHSLWNGINTSFFDEPTGQPSGTPEVTVTTNEDQGVTTEVEPVTPDVPTTTTPDETTNIPEVIEPPRVSVRQKFSELIAAILAYFIKRKTK